MSSDYRYIISEGLNEGPGNTPTTIVRDQLTYENVLVFGGPYHQELAAQAAHQLNEGKDIDMLRVAARVSMGQDADAQA